MLANTIASFSNLLKISNTSNKGFDFTISISNLRNENEVQGYAKFVAKNKAIYEDPENEDKNITFTFSKDKKVL